MQPVTPVPSARTEGRVVCRACGAVSSISTETCSRCGAALSSRDHLSLQKVWAWLIVGFIAYIPANIYPMLLTTRLFKTEESTILGGVIELLDHGDYSVAIIVFLASVAIPVGKFIVIAYLAILVGRRHRSDPHKLLILYEVVEFIGRWSMIDVFVVAILTALVQFDVLATVNPGIAALCFALSVLFTMLSAQSFDSRLIWDRMEKEDVPHG